MNRKRTAKEIYSAKSISLFATCVGITEKEWDRLMEGAVKANGKKIRMLIKKHIPYLYDNLCLDAYNPQEYRCQRTQTHLIYVHSSIEYFLELDF